MPGIKKPFGFPKGCNNLAYTIAIISQNDDECGNA